MVKYDYFLSDGSIKKNFEKEANMTSDLKLIKIIKKYSLFFCGRHSFKKRNIKS